MEIRPILKALMRNKLGPMLVAAQIAVTLAVLVNGSFIALTRYDKINRAPGIDVENIFTLGSVAVSQDYDELAQTRRDLELIGALPGVHAATTINSVPLSGSGWGEGISVEKDDEDNMKSAGMFAIAEDGLEALGIQLAAGRGFRADEIRTFGLNNPLQSSTIIVTQALADELFPDGNALNQTVHIMISDTPQQIVGIVEHMHGSWVGWQGLDKNILLPGMLIEGYMQYLVRTEPGERDRLMAEVEALLNAQAAPRIIRRVETLEDIRDRSYSGDSVVAWSLLVVVALLILITSLGIVGLASYLVAQRTKQVGTRRALGAQKSHIVRYFLIENWLITTIGLSVGLVLSVLLNYWMVKSFEMPKLDLMFLPVGLLFVWAMGLASAFGPARRASNIPPAIATRTV